MEATQVFNDGWMDKHKVVYIYNGILFILKKEENSAICYNMDEHEDIILNEISQSQED